MHSPQNYAVRERGKTRIGALIFLWYFGSVFFLGWGGFSQVHKLQSSQKQWYMWEVAKQGAMPHFAELCLLSTWTWTYPVLLSSVPNVLSSCPSPPVLGSFWGVFPDLMNSPSHAVLWLLLVTSLMGPSRCSPALIAVTIDSTMQRAPWGQRSCLIRHHSPMPDCVASCLLYGWWCLKNIYWIHEWVNEWMKWINKLVGEQPTVSPRDS